MKLSSPSQGSGSSGGGSGTVSGTTGVMPKFTSSSAIGDGPLSVNAGNAIVPSIAGGIDLGTTAFPFGEYRTTKSLYILNAASDANPKAKLNPSSIQFGPGGASVLDWTLQRSAAGVALIPTGSKLQQTDAPTTGADLVNKTYADSITGGADGTAWHNVLDSFGVLKKFGTADNTGLPVYTNNTERFRIVASGEMFYGDTVALPSLETNYSNNWRFTNSKNGITGGNLLFLVDNQSNGANAFTSIAASNDQGVGVALLSYSSGFVAALGHSPGDSGVVSYTLKDVDPAAGAGLFFDSGILPQKWITNNGDNDPKTRMYLTAAGRFILATNRSTLTDADNMFEVRSDVNGTIRENLVNASNGSAAMSTYKITNDASSALLALAGTGFTGTGVFSVGKLTLHNAAGNVAIAADGAKQIEFYTNPTAASNATRAILLSNGALVIGTGVTAQAGSELVRASGDLLVDGGGSLITTGLLKAGFNAAMTDGAHYAEVRHNGNTDVQSAVVNTTDGAASSLSFILRGASGRVAQFAMQQPSGTSGGGVIGDTLTIDNINMGSGINVLCRNSSPIVFRTNGANVRYQIDGDGKQGWFGHTTQAQQTITGAKLPSDTVLANLLTALAGYGLIIDSTT